MLCYVITGMQRLACVKLHYGLLVSLSVFTGIQCWTVFWVPDTCCYNAT